MKNNYDVVFLLGGGIGNVIQGFYAVEYCIRLKLKIRVHLSKIPTSFIEYLKECYPDIIVDSVLGLKSKVVVHSWLMNSKNEAQCENYYFINPDYQSTKLKSEDEHYLEAVIEAFPNGEVKRTLDGLIDKKPLLDLPDLEEKIILYPGCSWNSPVKRWPHFDELAEELGYDKIMVLGSKDDVNYSLSYIYPKWLTSIAPKRILNRIGFWNFLKKIKLLSPYAHLKLLQEDHDFVYLEKFSWCELVFIFKSAKIFIGNDGGLSHLAGAAGAKGVVLFGPTSVNKSKPFSKKMKALSLDFGCQPCFYNVGGVDMATNFINCPYQVNCLSEISSELVLKEIHDIL